MERKKLYVVSDGTIETAMNIIEFLKSQNPLPGEIDKYSFLATRCNVYWVGSSGSIHSDDTPPAGYVEHKF